MAIFADYLPTVLLSLIAPELIIAIKNRTLYESFNLVPAILEKVDSNVTLINLDKSKTFDRIDSSFLEDVLSATGFGVNFRYWIRLLYACPGVIMEVNEVETIPFDSIN